MPPPPKKRRLSLYTHPNNPISAPIDEITFSPSARQDYLTGFHKRKLARAKYARELAEKKEREERLRVRREGREGRRRDLEERVAGVNAAIRGMKEGRVEEDEANGVGGEGSGEDGGDENGREGTSGSDGGAEVEEIEVDHEEEYVDEDKFTTVLVEEVDVDRDGLHKSRPLLGADQDDDDTAQPKTENGRQDNGKRQWTKDRPQNARSKPKLKRKKFRYENKAERKMTKERERSKNHKQAKARREK